MWLSNLSLLRVPDEMIFQKRVVCITFDIYVFICTFILGLSPHIFILYYTSIMTCSKIVNLTLCS